MAIGLLFVPAGHKRAGRRGQSLRPVQMRSSGYDDEPHTPEVAPGASLPRELRTSQRESQAGVRT